MYDLAQTSILLIAEKGATDYRIVVGEHRCVMLPKSYSTSCGR